MCRNGRGHKLEVGHPRKVMRHEAIGMRGKGNLSPMTIIVKAHDVHRFDERCCRAKYLSD